MPSERVSIWHLEFESYGLVYDKGGTEIGTPHPVIRKLMVQTAHAVKNDNLFKKTD